MFNFKPVFILCTFVLINSSKTNLEPLHLKQFSFLHLPHILAVLNHTSFNGPKSSLLYGKHKTLMILKNF